MRFHGTLWRAVLALTMLVLLPVAPPAVAGSAAEPVKDSAAVIEKTPSATDGLVGWAQNSVANRSHIDAFIQPDGSPRVKVNAQGTEGWAGGFDTEGRTFVFQQVNRSGSDLKLWNVVTDERRNPLPGVNSKAWEWAPTITDTHLLFGRIKHGANPDVWEIRLLDRVSKKQTLIERVKNNNAWVHPGQVNGDFVVYDRFLPATGLHVWRYQISTGEKILVPRAAAHNYAPSVTPDGTVYHARSGDGCGVGVRMARWDGPGTDPIVLYKLPKGKDTTDSYTYVDGLGSAHVLFDHCGCGNDRADIFKLVDEAPPTAPRGPAAVPNEKGSTKPGWLAPGMGGS
jgi:hypothetical protein